MAKVDKDEWFSPNKTDSITTRPVSVSAISMITLRLTHYGRRESLQLQASGQPLGHRGDRAARVAVASVLAYWPKECHVPPLFAKDTLISAGLFKQPEEIRTGCEYWIKAGEEILGTWEGNGGPS